MLPIIILGIVVNLVIKWIHQGLCGGNEFNFAGASARLIIETEGEVSDFGCCRRATTEERNKKSKVLSSV